MPERKLRRLTVTNRGQHGELVPQVRMCGAWLRRAGFTPGTFLDVGASQGILVIAVAADAIPPDADLVKRAMEELQREYRRRFVEPRRKC
jgi:hypothetical protein